MTTGIQVRFGGKCRTNPDHLVDIERLAPEVSDEPSATSAECFDAVRQARGEHLEPRPLPKDVARVIALAVTERGPAVIDRLRSGLTITSTQPADVVSMRALSAAPLILPSNQPRGASDGGRRLQADDPVEIPASETSGFRTLRFRDARYLREWVTDIVQRSLAGAAETDKHRAIIATGVRRPIVTAPTLIEFENRSAAQWVLMAHDGITRLSLCHAALRQVHHRDPVAAAEAIGAWLVPESIAPKASATALLTSRRRSFGQFVDRYRAGLVDGEPNEDAVWVRQHLHLPIDLHLAASDPQTGALVPLQPAMESIVADAHTGVTPWKKPDFRLHSTQRAVRLLAERGHVTAEDADGLLRPSFTGDPARRRRMLVRGVDIVARFFHEDLYEEFKRALRDCSDARSLTSRQVMGALAPLICQPWGATRPAAEAWSYGGVAIPDLVDGTFRPTHPENYLDLVEAALEDGSDARSELVVAGGIALISDGLLSTSLVGGSGGARESLAFRGTIDETLSHLSRTREGLTALALAANHFDPTAHGSAAGRLPQVDLTAPDRMLRDGAGKPVWTTTQIIARQAAATRDTDAKSEDEFSLPDAAAVLNDLVSRLPEIAHSVLVAIETIADLLSDDDAPATSGLAPEDRDVITQDLVESITTLARIR